MNINQESCFCEEGCVGFTDDNNKGSYGRSINLKALGMVKKLDRVDARLLELQEVRISGTHRLSLIY